MADSTSGVGARAPIEPLLEELEKWLPELRGWETADGMTDWPSGFCHGESDYRERVIQAASAFIASRSGPAQKDAPEPETEKRKS